MYRLVQESWVLLEKKIAEITASIKEILFGDREIGFAEGMKGWIAKTGGFFEGIKNDIVERISQAWGFVKGKAGDIGRTFKELMLDPVMDSLKNLGNKMAESLWRGEDSLFGKLRAGMGEAFKDIKVAIFGEDSSDKTILQVVGEKLSMVVEKVSGKFSQLFKPVREWVGKMSDRLVEKLSFLTDWLTDPETGMIAKASRWMTTHIERLG